MRDRWTAWWARRVPQPLRAAAFDPAVADLRLDFGERARGASWLRRLMLGAGLAWAIAAAAVECRRLHGLPNAGHRGVALWTDVRGALRALRRAPALTALVVLLLGLGIGANVAVFSFANTFLLAPLPVEAPDRLVRVYGRTASRELDVVSYPLYRDLRDASRTLQLAAHAEAPVRLGPASAGLDTTAELVTGNFFDAMRVRPVHGRVIAPADDVVEGAHPVVVIGETYWRAHFNADRALVGRTLLVNGTPFEVIGIAPASFRGAASAYAVSDLWVPLAMHAAIRPRGATRENRDWGWLSMVGRLRDGVTSAAAGAELARAAAIFNRDVTPEYATEFDLLPASALPESDRRSAVRVLAVAGVMTALVLIAACANLAGVMHARVLDRRRELAVRRALGAAPSHLVRMLLFEAVFVAALAGAAGLAGGRLAAGLADRFRPPAELVGDVSFQTSLDWRVIAFAVAVTVLCAMAFALLPAIAAARAPSASGLKDEGPTSTGGRRGGRLRRVAVVVQVCSAMVLLLSGGLLLRSAIALGRVDPGFDTANLAVFRVDLRRARVPGDERRRVIEAALDRLRAAPAVTAAGIANALPLGVDKNRMRIQVPGYLPPDGASGVSVSYAQVGRTYFEALGIPIRRGAVWGASADGSAGNVIVINETMARSFWGGRDPVGSQVGIVGRGAVTVVGVARDSVYYELGEAPRPFMYVPAETVLPETLAIVARTSAPVDRLLRPLAREIAAADERIAPLASASFDDLRRVPLYPSRALASIALVFGALALLLTAVGLYGVVAGVVGQRTREFGVRLALGARSGQILGGVLRDALVLAMAGVAAGLAAGALASGALRTWLFGVGAIDAPTFIAVAIVVVLVTVTAAWIPARRASRIDPVAALRI